MPSPAGRRPTSRGAGADRHLGASVARSRRCCASGSWSAPAKPAVEPWPRRIRITRTRKSTRQEHLEHPPAQHRERHEPRGNRQNTERLRPGPAPDARYAPGRGRPQARDARRTVIDAFDARGALRTDARPAADAHPDGSTPRVVRAAGDGGRHGGRACSWMHSPVPRGVCANAVHVSPGPQRGPPASPRAHIRIQRFSAIPPQNSPGAQSWGSVHRSPTPALPAMRHSASPIGETM